MAAGCSRCASPSAALALVEAMTRYPLPASIFCSKGARGVVAHAEQKLHAVELITRPETDGVRWRGARVDWKPEVEHAPPAGLALERQVTTHRSGEPVVVAPVRVELDRGFVVGQVQVDLVVTPWSVVSTHLGIRSDLEQGSHLKLEPGPSQTTGRCRGPTPRGSRCRQHRRAAKARPPHDATRSHEGCVLCHGSAAQTIRCNGSPQRVHSGGCLPSVVALGPDPVSGLTSSAGAAAATGRENRWLRGEPGAGSGWSAVCRSWTAF